MASAFGIFLLRQTFKTVPRELDEAARIEGCGPLAVLWKVYVPLARPVYLAYALVSVSYHWNNFLWPLIITNSVESRPLTVGLQVFSSGDQGIDWSIITAATLLTAAPLLVAFLLFQRQFVQSFMRAGDSMILITWNVQWCRGVDGRVDPARIVAEAKKLADFDVLCLQEIADNFPHPRLAGSAGEDQFAALAALLPGYHGGRRRRGRSSRGGRPPAALRQHDPVATAGAPGVPAPAAVADRSRQERHAAHRGRGLRRARRSARCA